jgi:Amiloride-sensitive sodium channel
MSNVGGILGLMAGCSLLSVIEFAYFVVIRTVSDGLRERNLRKVQPITDKTSVKSKSKILKFIIEFLEKSSIHAAPYIAKRNILERNGQKHN